MAAIPGHVRDEVVIIGCHRDGRYTVLCVIHRLIFHTAWVLGAADPVSGTVSLHEIVRGLGALLRTGWRPLRTILIASWDAEEVCMSKSFRIILPNLLYSSTASLVPQNTAKTLQTGFLSTPSPILTSTYPLPDHSGTSKVPLL